MKMLLALLPHQKPSSAEWAHWAGEAVWWPSPGQGQHLGHVTECYGWVAERCCLVSLAAAAAESSEVSVEDEKAMDGERSYWWGLKRYSSRIIVQKASFQHTCWPCEDWINWAIAAKASADGVVELAVTAETGSLARGGEEPERRDATRISVWADVSSIALSNARYSYQIVHNRLEKKT